MKTISDQRENRVLALLPTGRDCELVCSVLSKAGIFAFECPSLQELRDSIADGAGALLVAEEALQDGAIDELIETIDRQPVWSDLPVILFSSSSVNADRLLQTLSGKVNSTIVERPIRITMLVSAVRGALRARERQYQARDLLAQLKQADEQKDLFLATLSHELRTPLNSILGWIQLLKSPDSNGVDITRALDVIERNAKTQAEMIADILFVSRVITGKLELNLRPFSLSTMVNNAIDTVRPSVEAKKISLVFRSDFEGALVDADPDRLQQVFLNLLSNAVKFTPQDGRIEVLISKNGDHAVVEICDNGQGINPKFLPFIFERFRQADSTYTRRVGGLGLGLAIARHLVELHGGTVTAKSGGADSGAAFSVVLPIAGKANELLTAAVDQRLSPQMPKIDFNGFHVLLVEDDADSREMLEMALSSFGVRTTAVDNAADALRLVKETRPSLLISDVGLPGEDGYDLIQKVRRLPSEEGGTVPAIALTGYVSLQDRARALEAGYQEHMAKPLEVETLIEMVKDFADKGV